MFETYINDRPHPWGGFLALRVSGKIQNVLWERKDFGVAGRPAVIFSAGCPYPSCGYSSGAGLVCSGFAAGMP